MAKWLKLYAIYAFSSCHYTTLLKADVLKFYLTLDLLQSDCSYLVSKWRGHTVATAFVLRGHCQTWAGCPETIFYVSTGRRAPRRISTRHRRFPGARERCEKRVVVYSGRLCPCTRGTFRARILTVLSRSVMTTNKYPVYCVLIQSSDTLLRIIHFNVM